MTFLAIENSAEATERQEGNKMTWNHWHMQVRELDWGRKKGAKFRVHKCIFALQKERNNPNNISGEMVFAFFISSEFY